MTLGADDLLRGRGVRLGSLSGLLDRVDIAVRPAQLLRLHLPEPEALLFVAQLAQALAGDQSGQIGLALAMPSPGDDDEGTDELAAAATVDQPRRAPQRGRGQRPAGDRLVRPPPATPRAGSLRPPRLAEALRPGEAG